MTAKMAAADIACFCEILARNYAPGAAAPGAWIIWGNILSQICSRSIFECPNAPGAYSKYAPGAYSKCSMLQEHLANMLQEHIQNAQCSRSMFKYAPGAVYIQIMLLEHIELRIVPQIIHTPGAAVPGAAAPGA